MNCFCGNNITFSHCCEEIILGKKNATTPEKLMRSRYSAYATNNFEYIFNTYSKTSQKSQSISEIEASANNTKWLNLTVLKCRSLENDKTAHNNASLNLDNTHNHTVEFFVFYAHGNNIFKMHELSRFIKEDNQWVYHDGDIIFHDAIAIPKRNEKCFCQSNKKFKLCCGQNI